MHTPPAHVLPYLPLCLTLRSLTQGHLPIWQVHNPYLLAYPNYHNLLFILLWMIMHFISWDMARPIRPPSLELSQVLYVPNFSVNLLSINAITKALFCSVSFFPYHCTFQDLLMMKRIGLGLVRLDVEFMILSPIIF